MHVARWTRKVLLQLWGWLQMLHFCHCMTMDEIIAGAMESPQGFDLIYDEASNTVRVDLDMLYPKENESTIGMPGKRQAIQPGAGGSRWTGNTVPYEIDTRAFQGKDEQVLQDAMNDWMKYTCLNFRPATPSDQHKIRFVDGDGCASYVGMQSSTKQDVLLAKGCRYKGTGIHELGHALGLHHEQTRPDRDEYVKIHKDNIPDHLEYNFQKNSWSVIADLGVPYDYSSIMHYGSTYFAEDKSKPTIETMDPSAQNVIGNRDGLSFRDIKTVNLMYNCKAPSCKLRDEQCKGEGFVGMDCQCWCPAEVVKDKDPFVLCSSTSGTGNQGGNGNGGNNGGNSGGGNNEGGNNGGNSGGGNNGGGNNGGNSGGGNWNGNNGGNNGQGNDCADTNGKCRLWAMRGECSSSLSYMASFCKKSCNLCNAQLNQCRDLHELCGYWLSRGHCHDDYASYMRDTCKLSCGVCNTNSYNPANDHRQCVNEHQYCGYWANMGYCRHPQYTEYMFSFCKPACSLCGQNNWIG